MRWVCVTPQCSDLNLTRHAKNHRVPPSPKGRALQQKRADAGIGLAFGSLVLHLFAFTAAHGTTVLSSSERSEIRVIKSADASVCLSVCLSVPRSGVNHRTVYTGSIQNRITFQRRRFIRHHTAHPRLSELSVTLCVYSVHSPLIPVK